MPVPEHYFYAHIYTHGLMLQMNEVSPGVLAVARCGAGVNNIPVSDLTTKGIPVFNTPGLTYSISLKQASSHGNNVCRCKLKRSQGADPRGPFFSL